MKVRRCTDYCVNYMSLFQPAKINFIKPGKRSASAMSPMVVVDHQGTVRLVLGSAGGPRIPTVNAQVGLFAYSTMPSHNTRPHIRLSPIFLGMDACMTSQLNVDLICKLSGASMCLTSFFDIHVIHWCLCSLAMAGFRSIGARIKWLYCN